jgi:hypothetical protein
MALLEEAVPCMQPSVPSRSRDSEPGLLGVGRLGSPASVIDGVRPALAVSAAPSLVGGQPRRRSGRLRLNATLCLEAAELRGEVLEHRECDCGMPASKLQDGA